MPSPSMRAEKSSRANGSLRRRVVEAEAEVEVVAGHEAHSPVRPEPRQALHRVALLQEVRR